MSRTKTTLTDRTQIEFEWFLNGNWGIHKPLIPNKALGHALRELKAQTDIIRNVKIAKQ